jgi:hypothetical protein
MQCHLGPELLCLLCKQQICMDRQAGTCTVSDSHCVRTQFAKKAAAASLHCPAIFRTQYLLESLMAAVVLQPHLHASQAAVDMRHVMSQVYTMLLRCSWLL